MFTTDEKFLIGLVLGDGNLHRRYKWENVTSIKLAHCPKEYSWLEWKVEQASKILNSSANISKAMNKGVLKAYQWCAGFSKFVHLYDLMYRNGKKIFHQDVLLNLGLRELAIFWCDDGCIVKNLRVKTDPRTNKPYPNPLQETVGNLAVYEDFETTFTISNWILNLTGAQASIKFHKKTKLYYLLFNKKSVEKLCNAIKQYVPSCMSHKIDLTLIPVSERARILQERAIRRQERAATLVVDDIV
jgi:hypothetical protein